MLVVQRVLGAKRTNLHEKYDYPVPANISDSIANAALREVFMFCLEFVVTAASVDGAD